MSAFLKFDFYEIIVGVATAIMWLIALLCRRVPLRRLGGINQPLANPVCVVLPIVFFTAFAGLRKTIGDTYFYMYSYMTMGDQNPVSLDVLFNNGMFSFIQNIFRNFTSNPQWMILFISFMTIVPAMIVLYKYSYPFDFALLLFVTYGYLGGTMDGMRQYAAAAFIIMGTRYLFSLRKGAFIKYLICVLFAYLMHNSALFMIVVFFVVRRPAWRKINYFLIVGSVVLALGFDKILPYFLDALESTSYANYSENGWFTNGQEGGSNIVRVFIALAPIVLAYLNRGRLRYLGHIGDFLVNIAFINVAIFIVALYNWIFARFAIYLSLYYIIFTTWVIYNSVKPKDRSYYYIGGGILFLIYSRFMSYQISMYQSDYFFPGRKLF